MKKCLYNLVFATLILMNTTVVYASNEVYYINNNGIEISEEEYNNLLTLGFSDKYIAQMEEDEFLNNKDLEGTLLSKETKYIKMTTVMRNGIRNTIIEEITYEEAMILQSQSEHNRGPAGNYYDGLVGTSVFEMSTNITGIGNLYMRFMNNVEWLVIPSERYYDVIGIGMEGNKVQFATNMIFKQEWVTSGGVHQYDDVCAPKYDSNGGLVIFKLPEANITSLDIVLYFNVKKQNNVGTITSLYAVGDYAHAICNVSPNTLLSNISISAASGIMIDSPYSTCYQSTSEATASFIGTW